ncbi:hypothetical protein TrCOL_g11487 [Triparma columacea]|uniref:Uncharacterized protein n=1 Tax=Triparma columacea TaxID=722753 RepID=A0A9W7L7U5_9STRA|nr:hypothetical protein TrCOL_g11487 [Triparma columacea]
MYNNNNSLALRLKKGKDKSKGKSKGKGKVAELCDDFSGTWIGPAKVYEPRNITNGYIMTDFTDPPPGFVIFDFFMRFTITALGECQFSITNSYVLAENIDPEGADDPFAGATSETALGNALGSTLKFRELGGSGVAFDGPEACDVEFMMHVQGNEAFMQISASDHIVAGTGPFTALCPQTGPCPQRGRGDLIASDEVKEFPAYGGIFEGTLDWFVVDENKGNFTPVTQTPLFALNAYNDTSWSSVTVVRFEFSPLSQGVFQGKHLGFNLVLSPRDLHGSADYPKIFGFGNNLLLGTAWGNELTAEVVTLDDDLGNNLKRVKFMFSTRTADDCLDVQGFGAGGAVTAVGSGTICPPIVPACEDFSGIWEGITESWSVDGANPYLQLNWSHVLNVTRLEGQTGGCTFLIINTYGLIDSPDRFSELGTTTEVCLGSASGSVLSFKELPGLHNDIDFTLSLSIEDSSEGILQLESLGGVFESFGGMRRV